MVEVRQLSPRPARPSLSQSPTRFCGEFNHDSEAFPTEAQVPDFKIFWRWTLDHYKRIKTASSLKNYWRVLRMHILDKADRDFNQCERRDIHNVSCINHFGSWKVLRSRFGCVQYLNLLIDEYSLRTVPKKKPVIDLDDLYLLLYTHWVLDNRTYADKR